MRLLIIKAAKNSDEVVAESNDFASATLSADRETELLRIILMHSTAAE